MIATNFIRDDSCRKKLEKLKKFGVSVDDNGVIELADHIYTEGGKNEALHKFEDELNKERREHG